MGLTWYVFPSISTSYDSITSWMAAPISHSLTSIPDSLMPVLVASRTASSSLSYLGLNVNVNAQSIIRPAYKIYLNMFNKYTIKSYKYHSRESQNQFYRHRQPNVTKETKVVNYIMLC